MAHDFIAAATLNELKHILNGGVIGGKQVSNPEGLVHGLHGLVFKINTFTVTFADAAGVGYKLVDATRSIKQEIEDVVTGSTVSFIDGRLAIALPAGITVKKTAGTANNAFGFSSATDQVGVVYNFPAGAAPRVLSIGSSPRGDNYFAHVEVP